MDDVGRVKHTPGPWRAFKAGVGQESGAAVASLWRDGAEREANARLIASAPRMFKALKKLVALDEAALSPEIGVSCDADEHDAAIAEAHAALAEAVGDQ